MPKYKFLIYFLTGFLLAVRFFEYKFEDDILGHQCQAVDPEDIDVEVWCIVQPIK